MALIIDEYLIQIKGFFDRNYVIFKNGQNYLSTESKGTWNNHILLKDEEDNQIVFLKYKFSWSGQNYQFYVKDREEPIGSIKLSSMKTYRLETDQATIVFESNIWGTNFTILQDNKEVGKMSIKSMSAKKHAGLALERGSNENLILGLAVSILKIMAQNGMS